MAEYYPLLAKAIAGLPESSREARQALYERARGALLNQLRTLQPPIPETDIMRETEALASAAARLESELTAQSSVGGRPATRGAATNIPPIPPRLVDPTAKEDAAKTIVSPVPYKPRQHSTSVPPLRSPAAETKTPPLPPPLRPTAAEPGEAVYPDMAYPDMAETRTAVPPPPFEGPPGPRMEQTLPPDMPAAHLKFRPEVPRPYAPQPSEAEAQPHARRLWIVGAVLAVFVAVIAVAAWKLRDRPEDVARLKPPPSQTETGGNKIVERIGGAPKTQDSTRPPVQTAAVTPDAARSSNQNLPPIPVAQRAALLVEAPEEPNKYKTYVGTVVWRLDNVSNGAGQPLGTAVKADIDIPEAKLKVAMTFQKNFDASLSASHTITLIFSPAPDSPVGSVKEIHVPLMRALDAQSGDPLRGIPVPIMENSFLIGLSRGNAEPVNLELIKQREWVDIQLVLQNANKIAKLTFEKSTTGARAIDDALTVWQAQQ